MIMKGIHHVLRLHFLIVVIDDIVDIEITIEQFLQKMKLVTSMHENVLFNVEQTQKKQKKTYATKKG
jgi:nucleoside-triphosphatase THEP1